MGKLRCCILEDVKKGSWTAEEDQKLIAYVLKHGEGGWRSLPLKAGLQRCGKSCRLRWVNYLRSGIKRGSFTPEEEETIIKLHAQLGNRWAAIAKQLPNRTDNEIKNYWNSHIKKRLLENGTEPVTHDPAMPGGDGQSAHEQPPLSKPKRSSAAELLNKLATRVTTLQSLNLIKSRLDFGLSKPPSDGDDRRGHPVDVKDYMYFSDSTSDGQELSDLPQKSGVSAAAGQVMNQQMSSPSEWAEQLPGTPASEDGFSYRFCDVGSPSFWDFEFSKDRFGSCEGEEEGGACI